MRDWTWKTYAYAVSGALIGVAVGIPIGLWVNSLLGW